MSRFIKIINLLTIAEMADF